MADFLGGLLSGGGGLYDDLLTPQQQSQLSSRGLLSMAGAFADAAMPSRFPVPLGAAIGKAAAAMSGGRDEAALKLLQGQKLSQEVQTMKMTADLQKQFMDDLRKLPLDALIQRVHGGGGAPAAAAPATSPLPATPDTAPLPAVPDATPAAPTIPAIPSIYGNPPRQNLSPYTGLRPATPAAPPALLPMPPAPPGGRITPADYGVPNPPSAGSEPPPDSLGDGASLNDRYGGILAMAGGPGGASGSSLPPPDQLIRQGGGPGGLLQASYTGAPPFGPIPGAGGDEVGSGGGASDAGRQARVDFWQSQGAPAHVAQGIADRVKAESSFNPSAMGDSNTSGGLYQHHADRLTRLKTFAAGQGKAWTDPNVQDQFAASEVRGGDAIAAAHWPEIVAAPNRDAAARLWDKYFERSKYGPGAGGLPGGGSGGGAAPGASGAPAAAGGDGQGMNTLLLELAKRNAMAEILKLGNPYSSMLNVLQGSPEYKGQVAGAEAAATQKYIQENETHKSSLDLARDLIGKGVYFDKETGSMKPITNAAQALAEIDRVKEQNKADLQLIDTTLTFPGETQPRTVQMTGAQARAVAEGRGVQIGGVNIPPMTGIKLGKPVPSEEDKAGIQARGAAQTEMYKAGQKALDTAHDAVRGANQRAPYYGSMLTAMQGFQPGATAELRLTGMQYLRDLGIIKGDNVPQGEALRLAGERLAFLAVPPNQGSWSNVERQLLKSSIGGMSMTPEGLTDAIRMMQQLDDYDRKVSEIHRQVADKNQGLPNLLEAQRRVEALGPPLSAQQEAALESLRQPASAAPAQSAPATPGAIKTPYGTITPVPR